MACDTGLLREITLSHIGRYGKTRKELYDEVLNDYGSCRERRFYRVLRFLVQWGLVTATRRWSDDHGYYVPVYTKSESQSRLPVNSHVYVCKICGMLGVHTSSHPDHVSRVKVLRGSAPTYIAMARSPQPAR